MRWPSWMPAGISISSVRSSTTRPAPRHFSQGRSISFPEPLHVGHAPVRTNSPKTLRDTWRTRPLPPQLGQERTGVSGSAPLPAQRSQDTATPNGTSRFVPVATSARSISTRAAMSAPRARPMRPPTPKRSSPKKAEKRSERLPRSNALGRKPPPRTPRATWTQSIRPPDSMFFLDLLDGARQLLRGGAHGADRLGVGHSHRAQQADCPERAVRGAVRRPGGRRVLQRRVVELPPDP